MEDQGKRAIYRGFPRVATESVMGWSISYPASLYIVLSFCFSCSLQENVLIDRNCFPSDHIVFKHSCLEDYSQARDMMLKLIADVLRNALDGTK